MRPIFYSRSMFLALLLFVIGSVCKAQNDVMMQAFYWNLPVDEANKNGYWWDTLRVKAPELKSAGITALWLPSPSKGNWGIADMGYGIYDPYDLGAYNQKGSVETRFGSKAELINMINTMHQVPRIDVYADAVLNHNYGEWGLNEESNPAVKAYVFGEAHNGANVAYQTSDIKWVIPNAAAGSYYIQIKGYNLNWGAASTERGYNLNVNWTNAAESDPGNWESEPNNGNGQTNNYPASGITIRGHAGYQGDIDEFKVTLSSVATIVIKLTAMREASNPWAWVWADQANGYYPVAVWYNGSNLANTTLQARTTTKSAFPTHTGAGEANFQWGYADFHPVDANDWLGGGGFEDEIVPNTRWFGNDFNTYSATVQSRLNAWGQWMVNTIGFDGYRLDFVRGFQVDFISNWINNLPKVNGTQQRYIVGEYWTGQAYRLKNWVNDNAVKGATVSVFDFLLKNSLKDLANGNGSSFDMRWLNHAGMVRNNTGNSLPGTRVSTFVDNHDTGKEHDKWVSKDWKLAYAYILTHEGRPCLFYPHFYGVKQYDNDNSSYWTQTPTSLKTDIKKLTFVRKTYLDGALTVLSEVGNPVPSGDAYNVYVARRAGNGSKSGAIVVLNNNDSQTKGLWVDNAPAGWTSWANTTLVNAFDPADSTRVYADGRVYVSAPARGYKVYVKKIEYVAYTNLKSMPVESELAEEAAKPTTIKIYPTLVTSTLNIEFETPSAALVSITLLNMNGAIVKVIENTQYDKGVYSIKKELMGLPKGIYLCRITIGAETKVEKIIIQ
jgi:alpha-amylase